MEQFIPVHKKGNRTEFSYYRTITLLPILSKVMEHVAHLQLKSFLERRQILHPAQHGFRFK